jgi:hypothetical protein
MGDVQWLSYELPSLTEEEQAEKRALKPIFKKAEAVYDELVAERNSYVGKEGGIPAEVLARYDAGWDAYLPVAKAWGEFKRKRTRTHGWVWLYLREGAESENGA